MFDRSYNTSFQVRLPFNDMSQNLGLGVSIMPPACTFYFSYDASKLSIKIGSYTMQAQITPSLSKTI